MTKSNLLFCACFTCLPWVLVACGSGTAPSAASTAGSAGTGGSTASMGAGGAGGGQAGAGGTTVADTGPLPAGSLEASCGALCDERYRCGSLDINQKPRAECVSSCVNSCGPVDVYCGDVMAAMQVCLQNLTCGASVDNCNVVGANVVSSDPQNDPRLVACMAKTSACSGSANPFNDDICLVGLLLVESVKTGFDACMTQPCDAVLACVNQLRGQS
jgi:hypothetical protein